MPENEAEYSSVNDADVHICIFPHLNEFLLLDVRSKDQPRYRVVPAKELLTPDYYRELEQQFSQMLHVQDAPFANLITLPQRLEAVLRQKGLERLAELIGASVGDAPRTSVFLCAGPILKLSREEMAQAMASFFENGPPPSFIKEYAGVFLRLLAKEKGIIQQQEADELRRAVQGQSNEFFTLWQDRPSGPSAN